jgi:alkylation response protein AidB-like acyl-CoA dehydrogenase
MTEPDAASSDATNITTQIRRGGGEYVINGRKWWISGALDERCAVFIVMGKTDPPAEPRRQQSMILVPRETPGVTIERGLPLSGFSGQHGQPVAWSPPAEALRATAWVRCRRRLSALAGPGSRRIASRTRALPAGR